MSHDITSIDGGIRRRVLAASRFAPVIAVASAVLLFFPQSALAKYRDLYQNNTLNGSVSFIYNTGNIKSKHNQRDNSGFRQLYSLNMRGKIVSSRYFIYDARIVHRRVTIKDKFAAGATTTRKYKSTAYSLTTTFIRRSAIPLTLRASRSIADANGNSASQSVSDAYGLDWSLKFRDLPEIRTSYDQATSTIGGTTSASTQQYRLLVMKDIGITNNSFSAFRTNIKSPGKGNAASTSLNYSNTTYLSRSTQLSANAAKNSSSGNQTKTSNASVDMSLASKPGPDFSQNHNYSFRSMKAATANESTMYSGAVRYQITSRFSTALRLNNLANSTQSGAGKLRTEKTDSVDSIQYKLTRRLKWTMSANYLSDKSTAPNATTTGANRTRYHLVTGLGYSRPLEFAVASVSLNYGYQEERAAVTVRGKTVIRRQRGMTQGASLGLSRIRLWNYALMNTSLQHSQSKNLLRDSVNDTTAYNWDIANTAGKSYVLASANYGKRIVDSWLSTLNTRSESYGIKLSTKYFARSTASLSYSRKITFAALAGRANTSELHAAAKTQRESFIGDTTLNLGVSRSRSQTTADSLMTSAIETLKIKHVFLVLKRTTFGFSMKRFASSRNKRVVTRDSLTDVNLTHKRSLLGGSFSVDYTLNMVKRTYFSLTENYKTRKIVTNFSRGFSRSLSWSISVSNSKSTGTFLYTQMPEETEVSSTLNYLLRSWVGSVEYSHRVAKYTNDTVKSNRVMFSLSRQFSSVW